MKPPKEQQSAPQENPLGAWFLGPKGEHGQTWSELFSYIFEDYVYWRRNYFPQDPIVIDRMRRRKHEPWLDYMTSNLDNILKDLKAHFPIYSPRYIAHMLSEQTLPGVLGYFAGMLYNPNNVTDEAAPVTVRLELEVGKMISKMIGYNPDDSWAHIASCGTIANLEALWVARVIQFMPLVLQEFCLKEKINFNIKSANGTSAKITDLSVPELIHLPPQYSIRLTKLLARYLILDLGQKEEETFAKINKHIHCSEYNPSNTGLYAAIEKIKMKPVIYVSSSAHYSIKKSVNILGYGEANVYAVPVNDTFRMDTDVLNDILFSQKENQYTVAVVAVIGTTEEGAVDGIHTINAIRENLEREKNRSFWLHADAAWGGYFKSLFCGHPLDEKEINWQEYINAINATESYDLQISDPLNTVKKIQISWENKEVYQSFLALNKTDSVTIDPHKMGYIPYPAGVIAFKSGMVTDFLAHRAQYISDIEEGIMDISDHPAIHAIGPYILEGSKPGAAAAACWLSHKTIPLESEGHGKIIKTSVLSAQKLVANLNNHRSFFNLIEEEIAKWNHNSKPTDPFSFYPLYNPDTNIVCFIAVAMDWEKGEMVFCDKGLKWLNDFNEHIYKHLTITGLDLGFKPPYAQPYFVSRTRLKKEQYAFDTMQPILKKVNITRDAYEELGLFVLRSCVMNPFYSLAKEVDKDYLLDFVKNLHLVTRSVINKL
jgi:glutamate/tyrosine decarboxylase-like PLP-dependent enzyme